MRNERSERGPRRCHNVLPGRVLVVQRQLHWQSAVMRHCHGNTKDSHAAY